MTFFGGYRGPAWETGRPRGAAMPRRPSTREDTRLAAAHGAAHPADTHAHGHAAKDDHEVSHGPAGDAHGAHDPGGGHGHGPWHGPHESPTPMTFPLMALAVGAIVAGFVGIPAALGGGNAIEHFLEPSFTRARRACRRCTAAGRRRRSDSSAEDGRRRSQALEHEGGAVEESGEHVSRGVELGLMALSLRDRHLRDPARAQVLRHQPGDFRRTSPNASPARTACSRTSTTWTSSTMRRSFPGRSRPASGLWAVDRNVVDGAVNGTSWVTVISAWFSGLTDRTVVDGLVNLVGRIVQEASLACRRIQTGLVQNYALLMLFGIFAFVSVYLFVR